MWPDGDPCSYCVYTSWKCADRDYSADKRRLTQCSVVQMVHTVVRMGIHINALYAQACGLTHALHTADTAGVVRKPCTSSYSNLHIENNWKQWVMNKNRSSILKYIYFTKLACYVAFEGTEDMLSVFWGNLWTWGPVYIFLLEAATSWSRNHILCKKKK